MSSSYDRIGFIEKINQCTDHLHQVLESNKTGISLEAAENVTHRYEDKYLLVEQLTRLFGSSVRNVLMEMGLNHERLLVLLQWIREGHDVNLRFERNHSCRYVKETVRQEDNPTQLTTSILNLSRCFMRSFTKILEYHYLFGCHLRLIAYRGYLFEDGNASSSMVLSEHCSEQTCITQIKEFPFPEQSKSHFTVNFTWLLQLLQQEHDGMIFRINRHAKTCYTPRRNEEVEDAIVFMTEFSCWTIQVNEYLCEELAMILHTYDKDIVKQGSSVYKEDQLWAVDDILMPILPIFHQKDRKHEQSVVTADTKNVFLTLPRTAINTNTDTTRTEEVNLSEAENKIILQTQRTSLQVKLAEVSSLLIGKERKVLSSVAVKLSVCCRYLEALMTGYMESMEHIESMLRDQLIAAIGKIITPWDLEDYMQFHYQKYIVPRYQPNGFSYAIRRSSQHSPEGIVRIEVHPPQTSLMEKKAEGNQLLMMISREISSVQRRYPYTEVMINASTTVRVKGEHYIHGWIGHSFTNDEMTLPKLTIVAETRQFSSYFVLLGRMITGHRLDVQHGFIVQNKDIITIPLLVETLPTAKQFRDAIDSLSPEQQAFAKAYRSMQLAGTLFAMLLIPIKPQVEQILSLPSDSLIKHWKLSEDVLKLLMEYHIPSDILAYDGQETASEGDKIQRVQESVQEMWKMIDETKRAEIEEKLQQKRMLLKADPYYTARDQLQQKIDKKLSERKAEIDLYVSVDNYPAAEYAILNYQEDLRHTQQQLNQLERAVAKVANSRAQFPAVDDEELAIRNKFIQQTLSKLNELNLLLHRVKERVISQKQTFRMKQQLQIQDDCLESLEASVSRLREVSREIRSEIHSQNIMLEGCSMDCAVEKSSSRRKQNSNNVVGFLQKFVKPAATTSTLATSRSSSLPKSYSSRPARQQAPMSAYLPSTFTRLATKSTAHSVVTSDKSSSVEIIPVPTKIPTTTAAVQQVEQPDNNNNNNNNNNETPLSLQPRDTERNATLSDGEKEDEGEQEEGEGEGDDKHHLSKEMDIMNLPTLLDSCFESHAPESAIRAVIFNLGDEWTKESCPSLVHSPIITKIDKEMQKKELYKALDLLDVLTRSGAIMVQQSQLHIIQGGLHLFDQSLMDTLIQQNINPIERMERAYVLMTSVLYGIETTQIVNQ